MAKQKRDFYSPFELIKIDRYSDEMIRLGRDLVIKMNVSLAKTAKDNRYFFYREYEYASGGGKIKRVSIKRAFDYFLSIEEINKPPNRDKIYVRINQTDYYPFWCMINTAKSWFTDKEFSKLYGIKNGMLVIAMPQVPSFELAGLPMNTTLSISPTVIDTGYKIKHGIEMLIDSNGILASFSIPIELVFAMYSMFPPVYNLYHEASTMISALDIPIGTNRVDMNDKDNNHALPSYTEEREHSQADNAIINGRTIQNRGPSSIDDLEGM